MSTRDLPPDALSDAFPARLGRPANAALVAQGIRTLADVAGHTEAELRALHGVGPKAIAVLAELLAADGLGFRPPTQTS